MNLKGFRIVHVDKNLHNILLDRRIDLRLTQQQVADRADISLTQYQRFERGERKLMTSSFKTACKVIEALEMNISDFYHGKYVLGEEVKI